MSLETWLLKFCEQLKYADEIPIRSKHLSMYLTELTAKQAIACIRNWLIKGQMPYRIIRKEITVEPVKDNTKDEHGIPWGWWYRVCQECFHHQLDIQPFPRSEGLSPTYADTPCEKCKSPALDYGTREFPVDRGPESEE